ncbi:hypothetical protein E7Z59_00790 [Robertkochia marina]|uniref:Uncharacterized protein n=1 Tax=Robertkochia marina TaxID=1227945 RepID=A0A4S3M2J1_9FLAO|nr:hypothetical protein [Robertkochia marina]THD68899.1 hypothetical protein E7Z59_00790 [Robertkochia marina]TRZ41146.1 hypothetical protein D3A96_14070 [Robertkochia marina]
MRSEEFDKKVRSLLQERKIKPTPASWHRLEGLLDEAETQGSSKQKLWFVAASVAVIMVLGALMISSDGFYTEADPLVEQEMERSSPERNDDIYKVPEAGGLVKQDNIEEVSIPVELSENSFSTSSSAAVVFEGRPVEKTVGADFGSNELRYIPVGTNKEKTQVSDREIEELLADARAVLHQDGASTAKQVDAALLLADIEKELDQNFKDKALEALKKGLVKLRTAVAERNQ